MVFITKWKGEYWVKTKAEAEKVVKNHLEKKLIKYYRIISEANSKTKEKGYTIYFGDAPRK